MNLRQYEVIRPFEPSQDSAFGDGAYLIYRILDGTIYKTIDEINPTRLEILLSQPDERAEVVVKKLLTRTLLEFKSSNVGIQRLIKRIKHFKHVNMIEFSKSEAKNISEKKYSIDFNHMDLEPTCGESVWHAIKTNGEVIAYVQIIGNRYHVFSDHSIEITGDIVVDNLEVYSTQNVMFNANVDCLGSVSVYGRNIDFKKKKIKCQNIDIKAQRNCDVQSEITSKKAEIKAGKFNHQGVIEVTSNFDCIAQYANNNGVINAEDGVDIVAYHWEDKSEAKLHCPGSTNITAFGYVQNGVFSTNNFQLASGRARFCGTSYLASKTVIKSQYDLVVDKNASLYVNGDVYISGEWENTFKGSMTEMPSLKVRWKKIFRTDLKSNEIEALNRDLDSGMHLSSHVQIIPLIECAFDYHDDAMFLCAQKINQMRNERKFSQGDRLQESECKTIQECTDVVKKVINGNAIYQLNLDSDALVPMDHMEHWYVFKDDGAVVAHMHVQGDFCTIYSDQNIEVVGEPCLLKLNVHCTKKVQIKVTTSDFTDVNVIAENIEINRPLDCNKLSLFAKNDCTVSSTVTAITIDVKANLLLNKAVLESNRTFECVVERAVNHGVINAKQSIDISSITWVDTKKANLHSPGFIKLVSKNYQQDGVLSTTDLFIKSVNFVLFQGKVYVANKHKIESNDFRANKNTAQFTLKNSKYAFFENRKQFYVRTDHVPGLSIRWKEILHPNLTSEERQRCNFEFESNNHNPFIALVYPTLQTSAEIKPQPKKPEKTVTFRSLNKIDILGDIHLKRSKLIIDSEGNIVFKGRAWNDNPFEKFSVILKAKEDIELDGDIRVASGVHIETDDKLTVSKSLKAGGDVVVNAKEMELKEATIKAKTLAIKTEGDFSMDSLSSLNVDDAINVRCKNFYNWRGYIKTKYFSVTADGIIFNSGIISADHQKYVATMLVNFGILFAESIEVDAYVSLLSGLVVADRVSENALISLSANLMVPRFKSRPNVVGALMALANTALSLTAKLAPGAQLIAPITQLVLNTFVGVASSTYAITKSIEAYSKGQIGKEGLLKSILSSSFGLASMGFSCYQASMGFKNFDASKIDFSNMSKSDYTKQWLGFAARTTSRFSSTLSGYSSDALLGFDCSVRATPSTSKRSVLSIDLSSNACLYQNDIHGFQIDGSWNFDVGGRSSMGFDALLMGDTKSAFGQNAFSSTNWKTQCYFLGSDVRDGWNLQTHNLDFLNNGSFSNGAIYSVQTNNHDGVTTTFDNCNVQLGQTENEGRLDFSGEKGSLHDTTIETHKKGELNAHKTTLKNNTIHNQGKEKIEQCHIEKTNISNDNGGTNSIYACRIWDCTIVNGAGSANVIANSEESNVAVQNYGKSTQVNNRGHMSNNTTYKGGISTFAGCNLHVDNLTNAHGGRQGIYSSQITGNEFNNDGLSSADDSIVDFKHMSSTDRSRTDFNHCTVFSNDYSFHGDGNYRQSHSRGGIFGNGYMRRMNTNCDGNRFLHGSRSQYPALSEGNYTPKYKVGYDPETGTVHFSTDSYATFRNNTYYNAVPFVYHVQGGSMSGRVQATSDFTVYSRSNLDLSGLVYYGGGKSTFYAEGYLTGVAPKIFSIGDLLLGGDKGVYLAGAAHKKHKHHHKLTWRGYEKSSSTVITFDPALLYSGNGHVYGYSRDGAFIARGVGIDSRYQPVLWAHDDVRFNHMQGQNSYHGFSAGFGGAGVGFNSFSMTQDVALPGFIRTGYGEDIILYSKTGNVNGTGSIFIAPDGRVRVHGHKGIFGRPILHTDIKETSFGFSLTKAGNVPIKFGGYSANDFYQMDPMYNTYQQFNQNFSSSPFATASGTAINGYNNVSQLYGMWQSGDVSGGLLQRYNLGNKNGLSPNLQWRLGIEKRNTHQERLGQGGIYADGFDFDCDEGLFYNSFDLGVKRAHMKSDHIVFRAAVLNNSSKSSGCYLGVSTTPTGQITGLGIGAHVDKTASSTVVPYRFNPKELDINAGTVDLHSAQITPDKLTGHVDHTNLYSLQDRRHSNSFGIDVSTGGAFSAHYGQFNSRINNQQSMLVANDASGFDTDYLQNAGGIVSPNIQAHHIVNIPTYDHVSGRTYGVSTDSLFGAKGGYVGQVGFSYQRMNYLAQHNGESVQVLKDDATSLNLILPIPPSRANDNMPEDSTVDGTDRIDPEGGADTGGINSDERQQLFQDIDTGDDVARMDPENSQDMSPIRNDERDSLMQEIDHDHNGIETPDNDNPLIHSPGGSTTIDDEGFDNPPPQNDDAFSTVSDGVGLVEGVTSEFLPKGVGSFLKKYTMVFALFDHHNQEVNHGSQHPWEDALIDTGVDVGLGFIGGIPYLAEQGVEFIGNFTGQSAIPTYVHQSGDYVREKLYTQAKNKVHAIQDAPANIKYLCQAGFFGSSSSHGHGVGSSVCTLAKLIP